MFEALQPRVQRKEIILVADRFSSGQDSTLLAHHVGMYRLPFMAKPLGFVAITISSSYYVMV